MGKLIEFRNFSFAYRGAKENAVEDISFCVHEGEFLSIVGPTGAGKTTLCRSMIGLIPSLFSGKQEGELEILGKPAKSYKVEELATVIGYVHQDAESQILMTNIEKEIVFPLENLGLPRAEIKKRLEDALHLVHLEDYRKPPPLLPLRRPAPAGRPGHGPGHAAGYPDSRRGHVGNRPPGRRGDYDGHQGAQRPGQDHHPD